MLCAYYVLLAQHNIFLFNVYPVIVVFFYCFIKKVVRFYKFKQTNRPTVYFHKMLLFVQNVSVSTGRRHIIYNNNEK